MIPIGTRVRKISGYLWPGVVVAVFRTTAGNIRYVVECTVPEVAGALHIYSPGQIERDELRTAADRIDAALKIFDGHGDGADVSDGCLRRIDTGSLG